MENRTFILGVIFILIAIITAPEITSFSELGVREYISIAGSILLVIVGVNKINKTTL